MKVEMTLFAGPAHEEFRSAAEAQINHPSRMVRRHGFGPDGSTCAGCAHLRRKLRWYKCELLGNSNSIATDVRLKWQACGKYQAEDASV